MRRLLMAALLLTACAQGMTETAEQRARRLKLEQVLAEVEVNYWHRRLRPYAMKGGAPGDMLDSLGAANARLAVADREMNRFASGR